MFGLFGFDPAGMSDDELLHKTTELQARLVWASRFGGSDMVSALQQYLYAIEFERNERINRMLQKQREAMFPPIIETDPELAMQHRDDVQPETKKKINSQHKPRVVITRSARPTENSNSDILGDGKDKDS